jgi:hypothetical protein
MLFQIKYKVPTKMNPSVHFKKLHKEEQIKLNASRQKKILSQDLMGNPRNNGKKATKLKGGFGIFLNVRLRN